MVSDTALVAGETPALLRGPHESAWNAKKKGTTTMKKTYIFPLCDFDSMESETSICEASILNPEATAPEVTTTFVDGGYDGTFGSRKQQLWSDEEEE